LRADKIGARRVLRDGRAGVRGVSFCRSELRVQSKDLKWIGNVMATLGLSEEIVESTRCGCEIKLNVCMLKGIFLRSKGLARLQCELDAEEVHHNSTRRMLKLD
jgi:hypothetical protein